MRASNVLFILSDEHNPRVLGAAGHPLVKTPNLDALARAGTRFTAAYCNSPICVPSRASFATGRYVHQVRFWDTGSPYDGGVPTWHHALRGAGHRVASIGKLHFRSSDDDNGFSEEILPLHVVEGIGDPLGWIRDDMPARKSCLKLGEEAGPGPSSYQRYDTRITDTARDWLRARAGEAKGKPWALFVSLVLPHFPLVVEQRFFDLYPLDRIAMPEMYAAGERPTHPFITAMANALVYDQGFTPERVKRAIAAYYGMVTALDENIGRLLAALREFGLADDTRVIYTSDHGDNLGKRGLWGKSTMYEESAGVPLILAGPDVPRGRVIDTPVSLVDLHPTMLQGIGLPTDPALPGRSWWDTANGQGARGPVFSEYHAMGSMTGCFMLRDQRFKYIHHVGLAPMLFDMADDPHERVDLAADPRHADTLKRREAALRAIADPDAINRAARADQAAKIAQFGGRAAIMSRPSLAYSPPPGEKAVMG